MVHKGMVHVYLVPACLITMVTTVTSGMPHAVMDYSAADVTCLPPVCAKEILTGGYFKGLFMS